MIYNVFRQVSAPFPQTDKPWELVCQTESDKGPGEYNWNSIIVPLTGETIWQQSTKGIWYKVLPEGRKA